MIAGLFFYLFALALIVGAALVVTVRQPVPAVLLLIFCFFNAAGLFLLIGAEFLAFIMLIVYVGAVAVLFLFVVMMLDVKAAAPLPALKKIGPVGIGVGGALLIEIAIALWSWPSAAPAQSAVAQQAENTRVLGRLLYTDYLFAFQAAGVILLIAMIGAIALTLRDKASGVKRQKLWSQLDRSPSDVVEVRKVESGKGAL